MPPFPTTPGASNSPQPERQSPRESNLHQKRRRIFEACRNCRKRKIRCEAEDDAPDAPCTRCKAKNLRCEYPRHRAAAEDSADSDRGQPHASGSSERTNKIIGSIPSSAGSPITSFQQPTRSRHERRHEYFQLDHRHPYRRVHRGSALYEEQTAQARQYLEQRGRISAPMQETASPYSGSRMEDDWGQFLSWSNDGGSPFPGARGSGYGESIANSSPAENDSHDQWQQPGYSLG
ncbi:hypothetical protein FB45DRAFT_121954 [Roridomyces roridus]|uniref:Zn(2)-C6 fungal-type domain-containing protein n=1 Tax=Roridomyces roridus TaxID=1738132 RepID=A0AAD7FG31_9AGAR|nr:hypothetical protein FB45DRAFT_121954 [Roridomyces roridus]